MAVVYKKPSYVTQAAKRKFGSRIQIMGVTEEELHRFWKQISLRTVSTGKLEQKSTTVVDVKTMCLVNNNSAEKNSTYQEGLEKEGALNFYNEVEIGSRSKSSQASQKTYQLQLGDWSHGEIGGMVNMKLSEANYYNSSVAPVTFETGTLPDKGEDDELLDKDYHVMERLKIPPKTKVTAKILTKAVTYELKMVAELCVSANASLPLRYKGRIEKTLGSLCTATIRCITAKDLFCNEAGYRLVDGVITFTREGMVSYIGEEVEIVTDMKEI